MYGLKSTWNLLMLWREIYYMKSIWMKRFRKYFLKFGQRKHVTITAQPPEYVIFFETISLYGRWSTSGSDRGIAHFLMATRNTIKGAGGKRTNEQYAWVNSSAEGELRNIAFPLCICRLTLAWISSEISTKLLGMPTHLHRSSFTWWTTYIVLQTDAARPE